MQTQVLMSPWEEIEAYLFFVVQVMPRNTSGTRRPICFGGETNAERGANMTSAFLDNKHWAGPTTQGVACKNI